MKNRIKWTHFKPEVPEVNTFTEFDEAEETNLIHTPWGLFRIDDQFNPLTQFDMWRASTNFSITDLVIAQIEQLPGIEVVAPLSRYQFVIAAGELFELEDVKDSVTKLLCGENTDMIVSTPVIEIHDKELQQDILKLQTKLNDQYDHWAIYVLPNGRIEHKGSNVKAEVQKYLELYQESKKMSNGLLLTNQIHEF